MLGRLLYPVLLGAVAGLALTQSTAALRIEKITRVSQEVYVRQESGRLSGNTVIVSHKGAKRAAPEGETLKVPAGATSPNTCDPTNASSQSCYTATQQGRAK